MIKGMKKRLKKWVASPEPEDLTFEWCQGKTSEELLAKLRHGFITMATGHMLVTELLTRIEERLRK